MSLVLQGCAKALRRSRNDALWQAWHIEAIARQKKLPKLKDLLASSAEKPSRKRMSGHEIEAAMRGVFAARSGKARSLL